MTDWRVQGPKSFRGELTPPGDKSISHRSLLLGALSEGSTHITNFLPSADCLHTLAALRDLGIRTERHAGDSLTVFGGTMSEPEVPLDMGNSGTGIRLMSGVLAGQAFLSIVTGDESIRRRPMRRICEPLRKMGASVLARSGDLAPLVIRGGGLEGIEFHSTVASAQVKSCVLLAGLSAEGPTTVFEPSLSRDHTERMLRAFGAELTREGTTVTLKPGNTLRGRDVRVPGDISSAAFFIVGALITPGSELVIRNVGLNPTRTGLLDALTAMGADITIEDREDLTGEPEGTLRVRTSRLRGATFAGDMIPRMIDEIPVLALAASFAEGETIVKDAQELRLKESDRLASITDALRRLGADVDPQPDGFIVRGRPELRGATVDSFKDHRIAMMAAIAGCAISGETQIADVDCAATSFPDFWSLLESVSA